MDFYFSSPFDLGGGIRNRSFDKLVSRLDLYTRAGSPHLDIGWYTFSLVVVFYVSNPLLYRTAHVSNSYKFNSYEVFIDVNFGKSLPSLVNVYQNTKIALQQTTYRAQLTNPMLTSPGMHYTSPSVNWSHLSLVASSLLSLFKLEVFLIFSDPST